MTKGKTTYKGMLTYSSMSTFLTCRKKYKYKYVEKLRPDRKKQTLWFGSLIHNCLEMWHGRYLYWDGDTTGEQLDTYAKNQADFAALEKISEEIDEKFEQDAENNEGEIDIETKCKARAMIDFYIEKYQDTEKMNGDRDNFEVIGVEQKIGGGIINPRTGYSRRGFVFGGKVDGLTRKIKKIGKFYFLLEHKTASVIDDSYISRLIGDLQIRLYCVYLERKLGIKISGIIYNILGKTSLKYKTGETQDEFDARYRDLVRKSKSGKSSAKRKMPETEDEYYNRIMDKYRKAHEDAKAIHDMGYDGDLSGDKHFAWNGNDKYFHREEIMLDDEQKEECARELWGISGHLQEAYRIGDDEGFYRNRTACMQWNRMCEYFGLCSGQDDEIGRMGMSVVDDAHGELAEASDVKKEVVE
jgi:hypothetical protein